MRDFELKLLIREIVRGVLNEYGTTSLSSTDQTAIANSDPTADPNAKPVDAMTPAEKSKAERDARIKHQKDVKEKEVALDAVKKQKDFYQKSADQSKRFDIPNQTKELQSLKATKI